MGPGEDTQTFRGTINWAPRSWRGDQRWEYEMVFSADYESIVGAGLVERAAVGSSCGIAEAAG